MDCIIPSHAVRPFCAAIASLSRIGKDLYVEFDPLEGLTLRALNDAKSAFCSSQWDPSFFERCSAPPVVTAVCKSSGSRKRSAPPHIERNKDEYDDDDDEDGAEDGLFSCRVPLRAMAAVVRPRRNVLSLRVYSEVSEHSQQHFLTFEFQIQKTGMLTVVHRMGVAQDANRVVATMNKEDYALSEMVAYPRVLLKMLEPLHRKTPEVALVINDEYKIVTATTFHHGDANASSNALLNVATSSLLKTETCISVEELEEFDFCDDREPRQGHGNNDENSALPPPPKNVNQEVALVFGGKEARALLQFAAQAILNEELRVSISYHWGGRPMLVETKGPSFSGQLIMATLDHKLLGGLKRVNPESLADARERRSISGSAAAGGATTTSGDYGSVATS